MYMDDTTEAPAVRLKGVGDSLWVALNPALPAAELQTELHTLFSKMNQPTANTRVVLDPGEPGHDALMETLGTYLKTTFQVEIVAAEKKTVEEPAASSSAAADPPPAEAPPRAPRSVRPKDLAGSWRYRKSDVLMISGRIRSGQKVEAGKHLVLLGDVNPGGEVSAGGDILIMGSLRGTAIAGTPDNMSAIILALDFRPAQIQIGGIVAAGPDSNPSKTAEFARVEDGALVVEPYLKANPFANIPWPEIR